ncbi:hypothetical protein CDIK_2710 [Cucumispora dikerogammari]|nr:hypothetical protein CDIK_2710 [Cucumispora dikerogammari]
MPRKTRTTITPDLIRLARESLARDRPLSEISQILNISYTSVITLINKINSGIPDSELIQKKGRPLKDSAAIKSLLAAELLKDNSITQRGMVDKLTLAGFRVSQPDVSKILRDMGYSRKRLSVVPNERNSPRTMDLRQVYAREVQNFSLTKLVYLDETGFNLHTAQNYGYSPINSKAYVTVPANRGQNISLMAAISINGVIGYELKDGSYNGELFINFILTVLVPYFNSNPEHILIMDNCRFHHRIDVLRTLNAHNILYKFIPPYSPQLNPIEEFFSELKANYRALKPMSTTRQMIKTRVRDYLDSRSGNFVRQYEKITSILSRAISRQEFI